MEIVYGNASKARMRSASAKREPHSVFVSHLHYSTIQRTNDGSVYFGGRDLQIRLTRDMLVEFFVVSEE